MPVTLFNTNDRVRHAAKPEWGVGVVLSAQQASHEGKPCQRLTVRFDQVGKKTISTAFADLRPLGGQTGEPPALKTSPSRSAKPAPTRTIATPTPAEAISPELIQRRLVTLPDDITDPFLPLADRLGATLAFYRFQPESRGLLDWASIQTGLRDSMAVLNRHELEQQFAIFRVALDRHLKGLLDECRKSHLDPAPIFAAAPRAAQHALRRINHKR